MNLAETFGSPRIKLFRGVSFPVTSILEPLGDLDVQVLDGPADMTDNEDVAILLLDQELQQGHGASLQWRKAFTGHLVVIAEEGSDQADFLVPHGWPSAMAVKTLEAAMREVALRRTGQSLKDKLLVEADKMLQLTNIGLALSAETDLDRLLNMILSEGRRFVNCDAASLFLVDRSQPDDPQLVFKLAQNDTISFPFVEKRFPLDRRSISGFVAVTGEVLNLADVYDIPASAPYIFNSYFDETMGYRTRSMVTIPMKNHKREVIGVLQFLNRKVQRDIKLTNSTVTMANTLPFSRDLAVLLEALASQAAVAIEKTLLINSVNQLFEGFVGAAVTAIEQRDPTTSGHSFRVADLTTRLALSLPRSDHPRFRDLHYNEDQIREIRYASLLHDFGKVGVREPVLLKAKKLPEGRLNLIWHRFALYREHIRAQDMEARFRILREQGPAALAEVEPRMDERLAFQLSRCESQYLAIAQANEPAMLPEEELTQVSHILAEPSFAMNGRTLQLLHDEEFLALSVRKGSLTEEERLEIQSHVVHTYDFLKRIPWTRELRMIPNLAVAHHEKLDGSGYPHGLRSHEIPLPSKMMTVADIYDALTASDRPYKPSMEVSRALSILEQEVGRGLLDGDLVKVFIESKIYNDVGTQTLNSVGELDGMSLNDVQRGVCDYDIAEDGHCG